MKELIDWLKGEKYIIDEPSDSMTENFEKEHLWELSRNRMIDKTIKKIEEDILVNSSKTEKENHKTCTGCKYNKVDCTNPNLCVKDYYGYYSGYEEI